MEALTGFQFPGEVGIIDPHYRTDAVDLAVFQFRFEPAGISEHHAVTVTMVFRSFMVTDDDKGILLVTGCSAGGANRCDAVSDRLPFRLAFHGVFAPEVHQVPVPMRQIEAQGSCLFQCDRRFAVIANFSIAGNDIQFFKNAVVKLHGQTGYLITQCDDESFSFISIIIRCRQFRNAVFSFADLVRNIVELSSAAAVGIDHCDTVQTEISDAEGSIFLRQNIQGEIPLSAVLDRITGKSVIKINDLIGHVLCSGPAAVMQVAENAKLIDAHLVTGVFRCQGQQIFLPIVYNTHKYCSFPLRF